MRILLLLVLPCLGFAQSPLSADDFFTLGLAQYNHIEKLTREGAKFSWIDKYEFRTETRDFDAGEQEYTIRLSPSSGKIRSAQKAYYEQLSSAPDFDGQELFCDYILSLHSDWLSLFVIDQHLILLQKWEEILDDKKVIYERMAGSYEFDASRLVKLEMDRSETAIKTRRYQIEQSYILDRYGLSIPAFDFDGFMTIRAMAELMAVAPVRADLTDEEYQYEEELLAKELELELAEKKRILDFVQLKYNGPHSDPVRERLSMGLGFQIDNSGSARLKLQELQIEKEELQLKSRRNSEDQYFRLIESRRKLRSDIDAFLHYRETMLQEQQELRNIGDRVLQKEGITPLLLLDIEERRIVTEIKALNESEDLLKDFLKYVHQSGKMCRDAFLNFLAKESTIEGF